MKSPAVVLASLALLAASSTAAADVDCSRQVKCLTNYAPVCGSDGKSYSNQCVFDNAVCLAAKTKTKLAKLFDGPCDLSPNPFCGLRCASVYTPVCGTDGVTYSNTCMLQGAKCTNVTVSAAYTGACKTSKPKPTPAATSKACSVACPMVYLPVCGSDGLTYGNDCMLNTAACKAGPKSPLLTKAHDGECPTKPPSAESCARGCPKIYLPQCGSDGKTYNNDCLLGIGQCMNSTLTVAYSGKCATQATACMTIKCTQFSECTLDTSTGKGYCADICTADRCAKDEICTLKQVQCFTTPCPPVATCTKA